MQPLDDTQPHAPFQEEGDPEDENFLRPPYNEGDNDDSTGPGCLVWGLVGTITLGVALAIVALAGAAGWTAGQQVADGNASATQSALIQQQLARIPTDVADGNQYNLALRINYLATLTPAVQGVPELQQTATALYFDGQPTETLPPTATPPPVVEAEITEEVVEIVITPGHDSGYDLEGLLQSARDHIARGEYAAAYELLDVIERVDSDFQRSTVRGEISQVLTNWAGQLYATTDSLAEAIRLTTLAEDYGPIGELSYERLIAGMYLDAQRAIGAGDHPTAINHINRIRNYQTTYKGINLNELLFEELVRYGNAWRMEGQYCQAVTYYNQALGLFNRPAVAAQRDNAQMICEQGTPVPPGEPGENGEGQPDYAPVGQPDS
jgi:tetratricopeptide (TPR) repeat protein